MRTVPGRGRPGNCREGGGNGGAVSAPSASAVSKVTKDVAVPEEEASGGEADW